MRLTCQDSDIGTTINHPDRAASVFLPMMLRDRETLVVMCLDDDKRVINAFVAAIGTADMVQCEPSTVFRPAMLLGACHILVAHNHPNGNPTPSIPDIQTTRMLEMCCKILGIGFVDHLVLTHTGRYRSIAEYMELGA
jgi:DNA repair protein RadC